MQTKCETKATSTLRQPRRKKKTTILNKKNGRKHKENRIHRCMEEFTVSW